MFDLSETFWLNLTNYGLGILCALCWLVMLGGLVKALADRRARALASVVPFDDHAFHVHDLGLTMADGGEPVDRSQAAAQPETRDPGSTQENS
jgi:hypothetical protein